MINIEVKIDTFIDREDVEGEGGIRKFRRSNTIDANHVHHNIALMLKYRNGNDIAKTTN